MVGNEVTLADLVLLGAVHEAVVRAPPLGIASSSATSDVPPDGRVTMPLSAAHFEADNKNTIMIRPSSGISHACLMSSTSPTS